MGAYKYITATLQKQYKERGADYRNKIMGWRKGDAIVRVEFPANISRARTLGFKAKQGYVVVRVRIDKGRRTRKKTMGGRKHKNNYRFVQPGMSHQAMAEQRANRVYKNLEVLNSYWVGEDGVSKYFEVLMADASKPSVNVSSVIRTGKAFRGLTSAGNSRGPSRKKQINKKLQRKAAAKKAFHFIPYVKSIKPEVVKTAPKPKAAPKAVAPVKHEAPKHETHHTASAHKPETHHVASAHKPEEHKQQHKPEHKK
jgi:large subunit ribosomal protein L15e